MCPLLPVLQIRIKNVTFGCTQVKPFSCSSTYVYTCLCLGPLKDSVKALEEQYKAEKQGMNEKLGPFLSFSFESGHK